MSYITGYTQFSSVTAAQTGNYLALNVEYAEGATTTVEVVGGTAGPVTMNDNWVVLKIASTTQSVKFVTTKDSKTITKTYSLTGLTLNTATGT